MDLRNSTFQSFNQPNRDEEERKRNLNPFTEEDLEIFRQAGILDEEQQQVVETEQPEPVAIEQPEIIQPKPVEPIVQETTSPFNAEDLEIFKQAGILEQPEVEKEQQSDSDILRGIETSLRQIPQLAYGVAGLVGETAEQLTGVGESLRDWGFRGYKEWEQSIEPISKETDDITVAWKKAQEGDIGALVDWAQYGLGYGLGQVGESAAVAILGATAAGAAAAPSGPGALPAAGAGAAGAVVAKQGFKMLAKNLVEKAIAKQSLKLAEEQAVKQGIKYTAEELASAAKDQAIRKQVAKQIGSDVAVLGNATGMQLGSIYGEAKQKADEEGRELTGVDLARIWGTGLATGGVEGITDKLGLDVLKGKYLDKLPGGRLTKATTGGALGVAVEGATEGVQTVGERIGAGKELTTDEAINEYINAIALGGLTGGAVGGVGGLIQGKEKAPIVRNNAGTKVSEIEREAIKEEELKSKATAIAELDPTKTATERLQERSKELQAKNIPNEALKVVEEQIKQTEAIPAPVDKTIEDILAEKAQELDKADIKAVELDDESKTQLTNVAQNKATPNEIKALKDKGYVYEVEGQTIISEPVRLGMGKDAPTLNERGRLEQARDRFKITNEELNNSTDQELMDALDRGRKAVPKLSKGNTARASQTLDTIKNELRRRSSVESEIGAGKRKTIDNRYLATLDTQEEKDTYIETQLAEATTNNNTVDIVVPKTKKINKVIGYNRPTNEFITRNETNGQEELISSNLVSDGSAKLEVFDSKKSRSRKLDEISEVTTQRIAPLPVPRKTPTIEFDEVQTTPLEGFTPSEDTKISAGRKAATLRKVNASKPVEFLSNITKQGGLKGRVADLLLKSGVGNAKVSIGRFGKAKDTNKRFAGKYNPVTNEITINLDERDSYSNEDGSHDVESTLLHELAHSAFVNKLRNKETLDPAESKAIREIESIYDKFKQAYSETKADYNSNTQNAFNSLEEFSSEILVNPELQTLVEDLSPDKSLLQKILQYILNFIQGKELNPYNEVSQAWKALNTLTNKPVVTTEAEVAPTSEGELLSPAIIEENINNVNRMVLSEENIPGAESGVLSKLVSASYEIKKLYNGLINQAFINPKTKVDEVVDFINKTYGIDLVNTKGAIPPSTFLNEVTGIREFNPTNIISFRGPNARRNSMIYGLIRSIATKQNATSTYTKSKDGDKFGANYNFGKQMSPNVLQQVSQVINDVLVQKDKQDATDDFALYPTATGVDVIHLGYNEKIDKDTRDIIFDELNNLNKQLTGMSKELKLFKAISDYEVNNWNQNKEGEKYYEEIDRLIREHPEYKEPTSISSEEIITGGRAEGIGEVQTREQISTRRRSDLLRRWLASRITPRINTINAEFSAKGYGNIGADYEVIKVNTPNGDAYIKYYPSAVNKPTLKELESIAGELIAIGEMDTQDADGVTMGGGMYPYLKSNDVIVTDKNGNSYRVVWANQGTTTKNNIKSKIQKETTNGYMALHIMQPESQSTNSQFLEGILNTIINSDLTPSQIEAVKVISGTVEPRKRINNKTNPNYDKEVSELKSIDNYVNALKKAGTDVDKIDAVNKRYSDRDWYKKNLEKFNKSKSNLDFVKTNTTFGDRGIIVKELKDLMFLGDQVIDKLAQSSDFVNIKTGQLASVVQLSKKPDAFAVWTGRMDLEPTNSWSTADKEAYNNMTETEKDLRKQLINSGKFVAHKSYDWAILGPAEGNNFILKTPVEVSEAFDIELLGEREVLRKTEEGESEGIKNARDLFAIKRGENISIKVRKNIAKPTAEGELLSPATDFIKNQFNVKPKTAYTKGLPRIGTRWFFNGKLLQPIQRLFENLKGRKDSLKLKLASVENKLRRAAKNDGVAYEDWSEAAYVAFMRSPEGTSVEQNEKARLTSINAAVEPFNAYLKRKLSKEQYDELQRIFNSEKITIDQALKQVVNRKTYKQLQGYKDNIIKRERDKADLKNIEDNIEKAKKEAKAALDKLPPNMKKLILDLRNELEQAYGKSIKDGVITPNTAIVLSEVEGKGVGFILPDELKKSAPRYGMATIDFESDLDLAAYVLANDEVKPSNAAAKFRKAIKDAGYDLDDVIEHGKKVKEALKQEAGGKAAPKTKIELKLTAQEYDGFVEEKPETKATKAQPRDKKIKIELQELFWANIDKGFIDKLKLDTETIDGLLQYIQDTYISNVADQIIRGELSPTEEELAEAGLKTKRRITKAQALQIASNRITDQEARNILEDFLNKAKDSPMDGFAKLAEELEMTDDQKLGGLPKVFKDALKPLNDAGKAYMQLMYNVSQDIINRDIFSQIRDMGLQGGWVYDPNDWNVKTDGPEPEGFVEVKSTVPGFSPIFSGLKVDPTFFKAVEDRFPKTGDMGPINKTLSLGNTLGQLAVTAYDVPRGLFRQLLGGTLFMIHSGQLNSDYISAFKSVITAFRRDSKDPESIKYVERLMELNLIDEDINMNRLRDSARGITNEDINSIGDLTSYLKPSKFKNISELLSRLYQVPDSFWRVSVFEAEKKTVRKAFPDMSERDVENLAAERTKEAMPTYARMNALGNMLRKPGIQNFLGAFVGFGMEVMRVMYSNANLAYQDMKSDNKVIRASGFKRLAGIASAYGSVWLVGKIAAAMAGIGDDEEEAARRTMGYNKFDEVIWFRNKDGSLGYFSLSWLTPFSMLTSNPIRAAADSVTRNDDTMLNETIYALSNYVKEAFGSYLNLNIFSQRVYDVLSNPEQRIYNPEATFDKTTWDILSHLVGGIVPANAKRALELTSAITGTPLASGDVPSKSSALLNLALGKSRDIKPKSFLASKGYELDKRLRNSAQLFTRPAKTQGPLSEAELVEAYNQANQANYAILYEAAIYYRDQLVLGEKEQDVINTLKDKRLNKEEINQIREGIIRPYKASDSTLTAIGLIDPKRVEVYNRIYKEKMDEFILFRNLELELRKLEQ